MCGLSYRVSRGREGISLSAFLSVIVLLAFGFVVMYVLSIYLKYRKSSYCDEGGISFLKVLLDKGVYFEFLIFTGLKILERYHRLLTNICLPKSDGSTTEIDVLMKAGTLSENKKAKPYFLILSPCFWRRSKLKMPIVILLT